MNKASLDSLLVFKRRLLWLHGKQHRHLNWSECMGIECLSLYKQGRKMF